MRKEYFESVVTDAKLISTVKHISKRYVSIFEAFLSVLRPYCSEPLRQFEWGPIIFNYGYWEKLARKTAWKKICIGGDGAKFFVINVYWSKHVYKVRIHGMKYADGPAVFLCQNLGTLRALYSA
jgi:hypothetical protein